MTKLQEIRQFLLIFLLFSFTRVVRFKSQTHCPFIIASSDDELAQFSHCKSTNAIHLSQTEISTLAPLDNLELVDFDPKLSREGPAVYIADNMNLSWEPMSSDFGYDFLPNLREISYRKTRHAREKFAFVIVENRQCIPDNIIDRLEKISGGKKFNFFTRCNCSTGLYEFGERCYIHVGDLIINRTNSVNPRFIHALMYINHIFGSLIINNTNLKEIHFHSLLSIQTTGPRYSLQVYNNLELKFISHYNLQYIQNVCSRFYRIENNTKLSEYYKLELDYYPQTSDLNDEYALISPTFNVTEACGEKKEKRIYIGSKCSFNRIVITPESIEELKYCLELRAEEVIIDETSEGVDYTYMSQIRKIQGCLVINNTSLINLRFLYRLMSIDECRRKEILLISNNQNLITLGLGLIYLPKHAIISISNNPKLCQREIEDFVNLARMNSSVSFRIDKTKGIGCYDDIVKPKLNLLIYYIGIAISVPALVFGICIIRFFVIRNPKMEYQLICNRE